MRTPVVVAQSPCMGYGEEWVPSPRFAQRCCFCPRSRAGHPWAGSRLCRRFFPSGCSASGQALLGEKGRTGPLGGAELVPTCVFQGWLKTNAVYNGTENRVFLEENRELVMHMLLSLLLTEGCGSVTGLGGLNVLLLQRLPDET